MSVWCFKLNPLRAIFLPCKVSLSSNSPPRNPYFSSPDPHDPRVWILIDKLQEQADLVWPDPFPEGTAQPGPLRILTDLTREGTPFALEASEVPPRRFLLSTSLFQTVCSDRLFDTRHKSHQKWTGPIWR